MKVCRSFCLGALLALATAVPTASRAAQPQLSFAARAHAKAVDSFRDGRFPEAYGRFVSLADTGHPASARYALWMCEHGLELFGKDWDCAPAQVEDWARAARIEAPTIGPRQYPTAAKPRATPCARSHPPAAERACR